MRARPEISRALRRTGELSAARLSDSGWSGPPCQTADRIRDEGDGMRQQFADAEFQFGLEIALGAAYRQASDVGEALATADRITDADADSWVNEWTATAEVCDTAGDEADSAGHPVRARSSYRRAGTS